MSENKIEKYVALAMEKCGVIRHQIKEIERNIKGQGHSGYVIFATVEGTTKNEEQKTFYLAVKTSKDSEEFRKQVPMKEASLKEIHIYDVVQIAFQEFQREKGLDSEIKFIPYCYITVVESNREILVFNNLKIQEFDLWDSTIPMTSEHVSLILKAYGQWHALSVALKSQKPNIFGKLTENNINMFTSIVVGSKFDIACLKEFLNAKKSIIAENEKDVFRGLEFSESDILRSFNEMYYDEPDYHVILHGDCWNNNFLFKTPNNPAEVKILDWQCSGLGTPVFDLSHFIFCCVDTEKNGNVQELLKIYYKSFSEHLTSYGCVPEDFYPFEKLVEHWKKFSRFGLFVSCMLIKLCMNTDNFGDIKETADRGEHISKNFEFTPTDYTGLLKRLRSNFLFYCKSLEL